MKKWILNVGLTTITVLPIVAVASCSSTTTESPSLTIEVAKYENKTFSIKGTSTIKTPSAAIESINKGSNTEKLTALQALVTLNLDTKNFTFEDIKAEAGTNNTVSVSVKVIENANKSNSKTVKFVINGFTTGVESALDKEVQRFQTSVVANTEGQKFKSTAIVTKITEANETAKLTELKNVATVPDPNDGFTIKVLSAKVGTPDTSIEVVIEVLQTGTPNKAEATFIVTGFATLTPEEILQGQASRLTNQAVLEGKQTETPLQASKAITTSNLDEYYKPIVLSDGITYTFKDATPNVTTNTTLDVNLTVKSNVEGVSEITKKVEITGFTSPQTLLAKEAELIVDQTALDSKVTETAKTAAAAITDTAKLKEYYKAIELTEGFSYALKAGAGNVTVVGDTVRVNVTVSSDDTNTTPVEKTFTISGFKKEVEAVAESFTTSVAAKNSNGKTRQVIFGLNVTSDTQAKKLTALNAIVQLPQIPDGFTIQVGEATQATANTSVDVALKILQTNTSNEADAKFTITTLTAETLQEEITRLANANLIDKTVLDAKKGETAEEAKTGITSIETLGQYYKLEPLPSGLQYVYKSNSVEGDLVKVTAEVASSDSNSNTTAASKTFSISGFKTVALVNLENEAKKLIDQAVIEGKASETATQAQAIIKNDSTLNLYYKAISLPNGYGHTYGGKSEVDKKDPTTLNVTLRVTNRTVTPNISILKVVKITGFANPKAIETEALRFNISTPVTKEGEVLAMGVISVINAIDENQANKLIALKTYVANFPEVGEGYSLSIGFASPDATTPTSVNIPITISPKPAEATTRNGEEVVQPVTVTFTITGLTVGTQEQQLEAISKLFNDRVVLTSKQTETAAAAQALIISDSTLNQYYQRTILPSQFSYNYGLKSEVDKKDPTTLNVTLKISIRDTEHVIFKVVQIKGFTELTSFEQEAQKFAISAPAKTTSTLTTDVISGINTPSVQADKLTALQAFVANFPTTEGYSITINTAKLDPSKPTSVMIPMTISKVVTEGQQAPAPVLVNFIITGLTVPPASE